MAPSAEKRYEIRLFFKRTTLPILAALIFLYLFLKGYLTLTLYAINPTYVFSLVLAVPFLFFTGLAIYVNVKDVWVTGSIKTTVIFAVIFAISYNLGYTYFLNEATNKIINDPAKYPRAVRLSSLYEDRELDVFPKEIPQNAEDVMFTYIPLYRYGKESVTAYYKTDRETVEELVDHFENKCIWHGDVATAQIFDVQMKYEHYKYTPYESLHADPLPDSFELYLFASQHLETDAYGILTYAAVNGKTCEVILSSAFWWN
ncbi:MAG: hypothetical protein IJO81_01905 [Clostridia bacterium]|nr:hypothetical protein [Clostridia bacterium]